MRVNSLTLHLQPAVDKAMNLLMSMKLTVCLQQAANKAMNLLMSLNPVTFYLQRSARELSKEQVEGMFVDMLIPSIHETMIPRDEWLILQQTRPKEVQSCQNAILEIAALKMSDRDRLWLFPYNSTCPRPSDMFAGERSFNMKEPPAPRRMRVELQARKIRWYEVSDLGQLKSVDALYQVISSNPVAFLQMLNMGA